MHSKVYRLALAALLAGSASVAPLVGAGAAATSTTAPTIVAKGRRRGDRTHRIRSSPADPHHGADGHPRDARRRACRHRYLRGAADQRVCVGDLGDQLREPHRVRQRQRLRQRRLRSTERLQVRPGIPVRGARDSLRVLRVGRAGELVQLRRRRRGPHHVAGRAQHAQPARAAPQRCRDAAHAGRPHDLRPGVARQLLGWDRGMSRSFAMSGLATSTSSSRTRRPRERTDSRSAARG